MRPRIIIFLQQVTNTVTLFSARALQHTARHAHYRSMIISATVTLEVQHPHPCETTVDHICFKVLHKWKNPFWCSYPFGHELSWGIFTQEGFNLLAVGSGNPSGFGCASWDSPRQTGQSWVPLGKSRTVGAAMAPAKHVCSNGLGSFYH